MNELGHLLTEHSEEEIFYFWMARYLRQWPEIKDSWPNDLNKYLRDQMTNLAKSTKWLNFDFSIENLTKIHQQLFGKEINLKDFEHFTQVANPTEEKSVINLVASHSSRFRDIHIVQQIAKEWKEGKHIFIVFGWGHVVRQEPAIKAVVGI